MSAVPKSKKLEALEAAQTGAKHELIYDREEVKDDGPVKIRQVDATNDFVFVMLHMVDTKLALIEDQKFKNEGLVVGFGPGVAEHGVRVPSQFKLGDNVMFQERSVLGTINSESPPYVGKKIVIIAERNIMCRLPAVPFEIVT